MDRAIKLALLTAGVSILENKLRKNRVALGLSTLVIKPMRTAFTAAIECGKIMRRILRKLAAGDDNNLGDISTLLNPEVVDEIRRQNS